MTPQRLKTIKRAVIATAVLAYIGAAAVGTLYGSAALFQAFHKQMPEAVPIRATLDYWKQTEPGTRDRRKLWLAAGLPVALFLALPLAIAAVGGPRRKLHGDAKFANRREVAKADLIRNAVGTGIPLGKIDGEYLTFPGERSVLLAAPTRSGKDVSIVIPTLLSFDHSTVTLDIKPELYRITAGFRAVHGQQVYGWAPFSEDGRSHRWNPLTYIRTDYRFVVGDVLAIAQIVYPTSANPTGAEIYFNGQARNLFLGTVLYLVETPELPRTMGEVLRQVSGKGQTAAEHFKKILKARAKSDRPLSDACIDALNRYINNESEEARSGIESTVTGPLTVFSEPLMDAATSGDDFHFDDLRRKRISIYVIVPTHRLADSAIPLAIFYAQLVNRNTQGLPKDDPTLRYQLLLINNEFTTPGRIGIFAKAIGYFGAYGLRLLTVIQAQSQLDGTYGQHDARTMVTNHGVQVMFAPRDQRDANEYSEMMGTFTEKAESKGRSSSGKGGSSRSTNISDARRALLLPQEFRELGIDKEVIQIENTRPILADKIRYWDDPTFTPRLLPPPVLPLIDLDLHRAKVEGRFRPARDDEAFTVEQIAADFSALPTLAADASDADVAQYVSQFFAAMARAEATPPAENATTPKPRKPKSRQQETPCF